MKKRGVLNPSFCFSTSAIKSIQSVVPKRDNSSLVVGGVNRRTLQPNDVAELYFSMSLTIPRGLL